MDSADVTLLGSYANRSSHGFDPKVRKEDSVRKKKKKKNPVRVGRQSDLRRFDLTLGGGGPPAYWKIIFNFLRKTSYLP